MKKMLIVSMSFFCGIFSIIKLCEKAIIIEKERANRINENFTMSCKWINFYQDNKRVKDFFDKENIKEIAIYGMGKLGTCLLKELEKTNICVKYIVDKNKEQWKEKYKCFFPTDDLPDVQAIIITPILEYDSISKELKNKTKAKLISLKQILE